MELHETNTLLRNALAAGQSRRMHLYCTLADGAPLLIGAAVRATSRFLQRHTTNELPPKVVVQGPL